MSSTRRWERAQALLDELLDASQDVRERRLAECAASDPELAAQVRELLQLAPDSELEGEAVETGRRFGPYEVVRPLGRGGMGEVFLARRADGEFEHEVALKILRLEAHNESLVQRFLRERQTLALLDHEYIARLLDGGTTGDGEPFFVMEYVDGEPADVFAARVEPRERLQLFLRIGQAVAHAHELGVVHRDLKPANILVRTDGTPRLLDFGIARPSGDRAGRLTQTGHRLFTPEFASPEQVRGEEASESSDVFALGVLLYEFLCGMSPWGEHDSLHDLEHAILEMDPPAPSRLIQGTVQRRISRDVDSVVLQCLSKRPARRYPSVDALCADVSRVLDGKPVVARRTGPFERAVRWARRRPIVPVATALALMTAGASWFAYRSAQRAESSREELRGSIESRIVGSRALWAEGDLPAAITEIDAALAALDEIPDAHGLRAGVLAQKAIYSYVERDLDVALALADEAQDALDRMPEPDHFFQSQILNVRAPVLEIQGPPDRAKEAARLALDHAYEHLTPGHALRFDAMATWASILFAEGEDDAAFETLERVVEEMRAEDPRGEPLGRALNDLAVELAMRGRPAEAIPVYRESLEILSWHRGAGHPSFAKVHLNIGIANWRIGAFEAAREELTRALESSSGTDRIAANALLVLARTNLTLGRPEDAETAARRAVSLWDQLDDPATLAEARCALGVALGRQGRTAEAAHLFERTLTPVDDSPVADDLEAEARGFYGAHLQDVEGDLDGARAQLECALQLMSVGARGRQELEARLEFLR